MEQRNQRNKELQRRLQEIGLGSLGDVDPLNKAPFKRATSKVKKGPLIRGLPNPT